MEPSEKRLQEPFLESKKRLQEPFSERALATPAGGETVANREPTWGGDTNTLKIKKASETVESASTQRPRLADPPAHPRARASLSAGAVATFVRGESEPPEGLPSSH